MNKFNNHHKAKGRETRWLTPPYIVERLGEFDLDPCGAPGHYLANKTYLLENGDDGLRDPWEGRIWLNPPYGKQAEPFIKRLAEHGQGTALIFARTETRIWHSTIWPKATAILFLEGRLTFLDANGQWASANAGAPSVLVAFGDDDAEKLQQSRHPGAFVNLSKSLAA